MKSNYQRGRDWGEQEEKRDGRCTPKFFPIESGGGGKFQIRIFAAEFYLCRFEETIWTIYLVVRLLDEGFHVVVPSKSLLCLGLQRTLKDACSLLLHGDKLQYNFIYEMFCALNIKSDRQRSSFCGCWFLLLLQRNNTILSFTCMTISLVSKEIQEISNELTLL